jgi:hypothetical protein
LGPDHHSRATSGEEPAVDEIVGTLREHHLGDAVRQRAIHRARAPVMDDCRAPGKQLCLRNVALNPGVGRHGSSTPGSPSAPTVTTTSTSSPARPASAVRNTWVFPNIVPSVRYTQGGSLGTGTVAGSGAGRMAEVLGVPGVHHLIRPRRGSSFVPFLVSTQRVSRKPSHPRQPQRATARMGRLATHRPNVIGARTRRPSPTRAHLS